MNHRYTYTEIKDIAKKIMSRNMGEAILITFVLPLGFGLIYSTFANVLNLIHPFVSTFFNFFYSAVYTYFVLRATIKITRNKGNDVFKNFFGTAKGMLNSIGVNLFLMIFPIIILLINWEIVSSFDYKAIMANPDSFDIIKFIPASGALLATIVVLLISLYVGVRLQFATYIVADSDVHFMTAIKQSWKYSKGNFFRILFFPFAFFFWMLLVIITCGIAVIYVGPLIAIGTAVFYNLILRENGEDPFPSLGETEIIEPETILNLDPLNEIDEEENNEEEKDIFDDYYK
ncbi:MAG: DUF975 family protein [Firmicutes bacterium]|nr:DUF975 family protein [Bacillota bacterium]